MNQIVAQFKLTAAEALKGALSDNDLRFLEATVASLGVTEEGNKFILEAMEKGLQRKMLCHRMSQWPRPLHPKRPRRMLLLQRMRP